MDKTFVVCVRKTCDDKMFLSCTFWFFFHSTAFILSHTYYLIYWGVFLVYWSVIIFSELELYRATDEIFDITGRRVCHNLLNHSQLHKRWWNQHQRATVDNLFLLGPAFLSYWQRLWVLVLFISFLNVPWHLGQAGS